MNMLRKQLLDYNREGYSLRRLPVLPNCFSSLWRCHSFRSYSQSYVRCILCSFFLARIQGELGKFSKAEKGWIASRCPLPRADAPPFPPVRLSLRSSLVSQRWVLLSPSARTLNTLSWISSLQLRGEGWIIDSQTRFPSPQSFVL